MVKYKSTVLSIFFMLIFFLVPSEIFSQDNIVFFGTHSVGPQKGISGAHFNSETGILTKPELVVESPAPAYFILHPDGKYLYACNSNDFSKKYTGETISAYAVNKSNGHLTLINQQTSSGADPSYIFIDDQSKHVLVANYVGAGISVIEIKPDGSLGEVTSSIKHSGRSIDTVRQNQPYAHSIQLDPTNRFALAADLGLDKFFVYKYDKEKGTLTPNDFPFVKAVPGSGPRHFAFHPNGKFVYLITEMGNTIITYGWNTVKGILTEKQTVSTLPSDFKGVSKCAEIMVHPNGKYLYATNRGHDSIALFTIDQTTGNISLIEHVSTQGKSPRNFEFDPTHKWLIVTNHGSDNAVVFRVDETTGRLTQTGSPVAIVSPFCVRFLAVEK